MALSVRLVKGLALPAVLAALIAAPGCVDIVGADLGRYVERDEKHFAMSGKPDVTLSTFDGSIEIRMINKLPANDAANNQDNCKSQTVPLFLAAS